MNKSAVFTVLLLPTIAFVATMWILRSPHQPVKTSGAAITQTNSPKVETEGSPQAFGLVGRARVIDGDTIEIARERVRLWGIDAPESGQTCTDAVKQRYLCGSKAAFALADFVGEATVRCEPLNRDQYRRMVARCFARGEDLGVFLVRSGWALDWPRFSKGQYTEYQKTARNENRGIWVGQFIEPWKWRACVKSGKRRDECSISF